MPYTPITWVEGVTTLGPTNMNHIEAGIATAPGTELAYAQWTSPVVAAGTTEAAATVLATCSAVVFDGSPVIVEIFAANIAISAAVVASCWLYQDGTSIGGMGGVNNIGSGTGYMPFFFQRRLTPSAASHTFSARASSTGGAGQVAGGTGGIATDPPGYIRITRV